MRTTNVASNERQPLIGPTQQEKENSACCNCIRLGLILTEILGTTFAVGETTNNACALAIAYIVIGSLECLSIGRSGRTIIENLFKAGKYGITLFGCCKKKKSPSSEAPVQAPPVTDPTSLV